MSDVIRFNEPYITGNELEYIRDVFERRHFQGNGFYTGKCQSLIASLTGCENVLLTDSCTSALEIAALLLRTDEPQEVIMPSYTFSTTASAFARAGFKIVFAEIDSATMMLDVDDVARKLSDKTTAIVAVHYGGHSAELGRIQQLCETSGTLLVEDAAQAYGCFLDGKALGTYGSFGCYSFHETKNIHAGLSGALLVNDSRFADRARHVWERGTNRQDVLKGIVDKYSWVEVGGSFYPSELQAAFLAAQLESFSENLSQRKQIYDCYDETLREVKASGFIDYPVFGDDFDSNYHAFFVIFDSEATCDRVREYLLEKSIAAYIGYVPLHSSRVGKGMGYSAADLPVTEDAAKRVLRLPFHNNLSGDDVRRVARAIQEIQAKHYAV